MSNEKMSADEVLKIMARDATEAESWRHANGLSTYRRAQESDDARNAVATMIAERDALREDAERYKFMVYMGVGVVCVESGKYSLMACDGNWYDGSEHATPREAIDAAREEFNHADQS